MAPTSLGDIVTATAEIAEKLEAKRRIKLGRLRADQRAETVATGEALVIPPPKRQNVSSQ